MILKQVTGGLSNQLYYCALPENLKARGREPTEVLLRMFGKHLSGPASDSEESAEYFVAALVLENVIFTLLSERDLGPKLYGVFAGGRLEEFIQSKSLVNYQVCEKKWSLAIARKLAKIHRLNVPINKDSNWLFNILERWTERVSEVSLESVVDRKDKEIAKRLLAIDYNAEISWLRKFMSTVNSPIVFSHNDLQGGNILCRQLSEKNERNGRSQADDSNCETRLTVIDFEFCSYNFRAYDIANHLTEWMYDYGLEESPYYTCKREKFPSKAEQVDFLRTYVETYFENNADVPMSLKRGSLTMDQQLEVIMKEVNAFQMVPHLLWGLWSIKNSVGSKILFAYWDYAASRIDHYFSSKKALMDQLRLAENAVPMKIGNKRNDMDILNPGRSKRHLSLDAHQIERWNSEERLSIN